MPKKKVGAAGGYDTSRVELVRRDIACGACGALLYVMVPSDASGQDACDCSSCGAQIGFSYDLADPMVGTPVDDDAEIPF